MDCVFCKIIDGQLSSTLRGENDFAVAFDTIQPAASTHVLIVPKKHIPSFTELTDSDGGFLSGMVGLTKELIASMGISDGYKLVTNGGKYQSVKHLHWHLLAGDLEKDNT